ncbi:MAG: manganese efflux pump MntP family protein [Bacteroidota bacterium]
MTNLESLILAFSLSLDAMAVSLALSAGGHLRTTRAKFRIVFHFGLFQFLMPVAGWAIGTRIEPFIASSDRWIAAGLLAFVAVRMIRSAYGPLDTREANDPSRGWTLVTLATATSIDALAVGLGLAALRISVWYPSVVIGLITLLLSTIAILLGQRAGSQLGKRGQIVGGIVLLLVALKIIIVHN